MKILDYNYTNPRDPYVIFYQGKYYTLMSYENKLWLKVTDRLEDILNAEMHVIFTPEGEYSQCIWAPELHIIDDIPYIYVTMSIEYGKPQHMFVLTTESKKIDDNYKVISYLRHGDDAWAIDGTILKKDKKIYYIYSAFGEYGGELFQALYIAEMENPYTLKGEAKLLTKSKLDWEMHGCNGKDRPYVTEGPFALYKNNDIYVVYSSSGCWTDYYCLGLLKFKGGDILSSENWEKYPHAILDNSSGFVAPGHASFIQNDPSGVEYCIFHAYEKDSSRGEKFVHAYIYPVTWIDDIPKIKI
ncbi:MAG: glycoside hydrolase family 43 protein [Clostridia bacterium]|nr:glycoside hydrolase family 43 protein [Clostridia bacterium]